MRKGVGADDGPYGKRRTVVVHSGVAIRSGGDDGSGRVGKTEKRVSPGGSVRAPTRTRTHYIPYDILKIKQQIHVIYKRTVKSGATNSALSLKN